VDRVYLDRVEIEYTAWLAIGAGGLVFGGRTGEWNYAAGGLAAPAPVWLADVTDPALPELLAGAETAPLGTAYGIRFGEAAGATPRRYACMPDSTLPKPAGIERVAWPDLGDPQRQADLVIIAPSRFVPVLGRLAERREAQGLRTVIVPLADIYNEFGYGVEDAAAIKQFIGYAAHHWAKPAPRYVLLAGSGSFDPKGYLLAQRGQADFRKREQVPLAMGPWTHGWTSKDGWYGTVTNADLIPDLAIGRLPATSTGMLSNMINKIIVFEQAPIKNWRRKQALLVADWSDSSLNGKAACEFLRRADLSPRGFWCTTAYLDDIGSALCRDVAINTINKGAFLVYYFGHGAADRWGHDIMTTVDAARLQNTYPPIFLMMACRNGALQNPLDGPSMMEALLQDASNGASACIGTTAISYGDSCVAFSDGFSHKLVNEQGKRLGDAFLAGLRTLWDYNPYTHELLLMNLFADPAMLVNP
jgi:hypothetical protein